MRLCIGRAYKPPVEKLVKTHCCFCGMQVVTSRRSQNQVAGFEPWEEFPSQRGPTSCPQGRPALRRRTHPDRSTKPLIRTTGGSRGKLGRGA